MLPLVFLGGVAAGAGGLLAAALWEKTEPRRNTLRRLKARKNSTRRKPLICRTTII